MIEPKCKAAYNRSTVALVISIIAVIYATWYLPGLVRVLNKLSDQMEKQNAGITGRD